MSRDTNSLPLLKLSSVFLRTFFGSKSWLRGKEYFLDNRVVSCEFDNSSREITGNVQGSKTYQSSISLSPDYDLIVAAICTCPRGGSCKHALALVLFALRECQQQNFLVPLPEQSTALQIVEGIEDVIDAEVVIEEMLEQKDAGGSVSRWLHALSDSRNSNVTATEKNPELIHYIFYAKPIAGFRSVLQVDPVRTRKLKNRDWGKPRPTSWSDMNFDSLDWLSANDAEIAHLMYRARHELHSSNTNTMPANFEVASTIIERLLSTGRCYWQQAPKSEAVEPIQKGLPRPAELYWKANSNGTQSLSLRSDAAAEIELIGGGFWYYDRESNSFGELRAPAELPLHLITDSPPVEPFETMAVASAFKQLGIKLPIPKTNFNLRRMIVEPLPLLTLLDWNRDSLNCEASYEAVVKFDYGIKELAEDISEIRTIENETIVVYRKNLSREKAYLSQIESFGLERVSNPDEHSYLFPGTDSEAELNWLRFYKVAVPQLARLGWRVRIDPSFQLALVQPDEEWNLEASEGRDFWLSLDLGIMVNGEKFSLLPIIYDAIAKVSSDDPLEALPKLNKNGMFYARLPDGRKLALPFERVRVVVESLIELFDMRLAFNPRIPKANLFKISNAIKKQTAFKLGDRIKEKVEKFEGLELISVPENFGAKLRPYQLDGLSWLNLLREFELGGILADDMGLGKTVQTIAHICLEKEQGRLEKPFLVVCPTSVLPNWSSEMQKFASHLKTLCLWGPNRSANYSEIKGTDVVFTTYPIVSRDAGAICEYEWKAIVLDEAQTIKNPSTALYDDICKLKADYRICLTGTPVENHLGDLWAQFNFLMPGFLGDRRWFAKTFRNPIERQKRRDKQNQLASHVRAYLLRRTKELVRDELPEKSIIVKRCELEGDQRDLYETIRLSMYDRVKSAIAERGLEKSQIIILDALLKLRQVCCDPRLLSLAAARKVNTSVKLQTLLEMIEELLNEDKRILLFSQFTSMLDLVVPELTKRNIEYVEIRGDTKDRASPVENFQSGKVPLFLLSLKSGGYGLNLTAADTVIHYDPWWNPAVETQATDRAHRLGQTRRVFVFKMIAAGTIEERMLELQERKRAIANAIYNDENDMPLNITQADLESLFKPLGK